MSNEAEQIAQRQANLEELIKLGVPPYPARFERTTSISELVAEHGGASAEALEAARPSGRIAGRILGLRSFGKANFLVLSDGRARLQVYVRADSVSDLDFKIFKLLDLGDLIGVEGRLFRTKTNELTLWAARIAFLAKCLVPLPEKWHGLTDVEARYRQRYLDLIVNQPSRQVFETRAAVVAAVRRFLNARGFLEVETPMMQPLAGGALARPFVTHHNALDLDLYLRIAPELYLKRLTVGGFERVYEINRNFRNEGISTQHNPEFTMLEFYEAYVDYEHLMRLTEEMLMEVAREAVANARGRRSADHRLSFAAPYRRLSLRGAAAEAASARLGRAVTESDLRDRERAAGLARALGLDVSAAHGAGKIATTMFRGAVGAEADPADVRVRLSDRGIPALEAEGRRSRHGRTIRIVRRRFRDRQRLQRAERSARAAPPLRGAARATRRRGRRGPSDGRGLRPRARIRAAADRRGGDRHRSPGHAVDQQRLDSRRHPVPADATKGGLNASKDSHIGEPCIGEPCIDMACIGARAHRADAHVLDGRIPDARIVDARAADARVADACNADA